MLKIIICVVAVTFIVIVGFLVIDPKVNNNTSETTTSLNSNVYSVTVEGEVNKTGTYSLEEGSTIYDLIQAAGGVTNNADELAYYEEAIVSKGMTYYIAPKYDTSNVCNSEEIEKVNINSDDASTLQNVSSITSSLATSIVSYRQENGLYSTIEDLLDVYGIGNATYKKIRNYVTLHN